MRTRGRQQGCHTFTVASSEVEERWFPLGWKAMLVTFLSCAG